jgi:hypothetical protein
VDGVVGWCMALSLWSVMFVNRTDLVPLLFEVKERLRTGEGKLLPAPF